MTDEATRLSEHEAAAELGVDFERLRRWRDQGDAPPHHVEEADGSVYYVREDLVAWREHYVYPPGEVEGG